MRPLRFAKTLTSGLALVSLLLTPSALAQSPEQDFFQAYYLQHELGQLEPALELYLGVARSQGAERSLRHRAKIAAGEIGEDLAASDFARLMPENTIFYLEINRPGDQIAELVDQLGLLGVAEDGRGFGISPHLLQGALGLRGAAVAITEIDPNGGPPKGVLVLHPGDQEVVRGLIETGLPSGGQPVDAIGGYPTWNVERQAFVTLTSRLLVAGTSRAHVEGVIARMKGKNLRSLAGAASLESAQSLRGDDLIFFHLNAEPIIPMLRMALEHEARRNPEARMAVAFLDIDTLEGFSGRLGIDGNGLGLDLSLQLEEGHQNFLFNLMRTPALSEDTLKLVPRGAAFFLATSFNESSCVAPASGDPGRPIVTAMDFGREVFANLVDVVVYGMPPQGQPQGGMPIPDVVTCLRVNDVDRSRALWNFVLGLASQSSGSQSTAPDVVTIAGVDCERYQIGGVPVYLVTRENEMMISPSRSAIAQTLKAREKGSSILRDELFATSLEGLGHDNTTALLVNPGRCAMMARPFIPEHEVAEFEPVAQILAETVLSVGLRQNDTTLGLSTRIQNLPDLSPVVAMLMEQRHGRAHAPAPAQLRFVDEKPARQKPRPQPTADLGELRKRLLESALADDRAKTDQIGGKIFKLLGDDWNALNDFAWALLTEDPFRGNHTKLARKVARTSNELTDFGSWAALDTLALAEFESGNVAKALELEKKALKLAEGTGREPEIEAALERFKKGLKKQEAKGKKKKSKKVVDARHP
jgi:tetratricopeptide (TPR) repeat protein